MTREALSGNILQCTLLYYFALIFAMKLVEVCANQWVGLEICPQLNAFLTEFSLMSFHKQHIHRCFQCVFFDDLQCSSYHVSYFSLADKTYTKFIQFVFFYTPQYNQIWALEYD